MRNIIAANIVRGNLANEPKYWPNNEKKVSVWKTTVAINKGYYDRDTNKWVNKEAEYVSLTAFGTLADTLNQLTETSEITKGMPIIATGNIDDHPQTWIDKDGNTHAELGLLLDSLSLDLISLARRNKQSQTAGTEPEETYNTESNSDGFAPDPLS